jgi:hypothetical protein
MTASNQSQAGVVMSGLAFPDSWVTMPDGFARNSIRSAGEAKVDKGQDRLGESPNYVLFPMAVGALFLAFLVVGALLG